MAHPALTTQNEGINIDEIHAFTVQLAKDAGKMLLGAAEARMSPSHASGTDQIIEKDSAVDLVTQTDEGAYLHSPRVSAWTSAALLPKSR